MDITNEKRIARDISRYLIHSLVFLIISKLQNIKLIFFKTLFSLLYLQTRFKFLHILFKEAYPKSILQKARRYRFTHHKIYNCFNTKDNYIFYTLDNSRKKSVLVVTTPILFLSKALQCKTRSRY